MVWTQESYHKVKYDRPGECSPEKDCLRWHWLTFRQPERKSSSESSDLTLKMTSAQVVETSVNVISNSPSQDYTHPDDRTLLYDNVVYPQSVNLSACYTAQYKK